MLVQECKYNYYAPKNDYVLMTATTQNLYFTAEN